MAFKVVKSTTAKITEKFHVYAGEDGAEIETSITLYGKTRRQSEWDALYKAAQEDGSNLTLTQRNAEFYAQVFHDWDVTTEDGNKLVCNAEGFGIVLDHDAGPQIVAALQRAAYRLRYGTPVKN